MNSNPFRGNSKVSKYGYQMTRLIKIIFKKLVSPIIHPLLFFRFVSLFYEYSNGYLEAKYKLNYPNKTAESKNYEENRLIDFYLNQDHRGMTKLIHYLYNYENHFDRLKSKRNKRKIRILEIGVFSGGSLQMYESFFGSDKVEIVGVDIDEDCLNFKSENTTIEIGDQEDKLFWKQFNSKYNSFDLIVDDAGHLCEQQLITFESLIERLNPGGLFIIEDVSERFLHYMLGFVSEFNRFHPTKSGPFKTSPVQQHFLKVEFTPNCIILQKYDEGITPEFFRGPWIGNSWTKSAQKLYSRFNAGKKPSTGKVR